MTTTLEFDQALESSDGGETVFEIVTTVSEVASLHEQGFLKVTNARPDNALVPTARGGERFARTSKRLKRWTEQLSENKGILGNLTWNVDPDSHDVDLDDDGVLRVTAKEPGSPVVLTTPDSATRHRAIINAMQAPLRTLHPDRRVSIRVWQVTSDRQQAGGLTEAAVFDSYNQDGKPVNATVARFNYQRGPVEELARRLVVDDRHVVDNRHLGTANVETVENSVSRSSAKLCAFNTIATAFREGWSTDMGEQSNTDVDTELAWVSQAWDHLVELVPTLGRLTVAQRQTARAESVAGAAVLVHAYVRLLDLVRTSGAPLSVLDPLRDSKVTLRQDSTRTRTDPTSGQPVPLAPAGSVVDLFSLDNPLWTSVGVVATRTRPDGTTTAEVRNAYQTRSAAFTALKAALYL